MVVRRSAGASNIRAPWDMNVVTADSGAAGLAGHGEVFKCSGRDARALQLRFDQYPRGRSGGDDRLLPGYSRNLKRRQGNRAAVAGFVISNQ